MTRMTPPRAVVISALGITQILAWGSTYYLLAVLAEPIARETGWPLTMVVGGLTLGLIAASVVSPRVGNAIQATGGRPVMSASSLIMATGLAGLAFVDHPALYFTVWVLLGIGMGAGLYDAAFATLGRLYGKDARGAITALTLYGGFASTLCWPLSAFLVETLGWRGACLTYAGIHLFINLPLHVFALPRFAPDDPARPRQSRREVLTALLRGRESSGARITLPESDRLVFALLATGLTIGGIASAVLSVHLLTVLQARDIALAAAVGLGALVGPSQVGGRILEMLIGRKFHPLWTAAVSAILIFAGVTLLAGHAPLIALALMLYGAGIGIRSIVRGTLPLALFDPGIYATMMGRLAAPILLLGALSPLAAAWIIDAFGPDLLLVILVALCLTDIILIGLVALAAQRRARLQAQAAEPEGVAAVAGSGQETPVPPRPQ
ncbi:MAG: Arabinose efflux permease [Saliniramus fredricksonii]|uniref:Arabinose efflux permease n=1 Tax=Saliniramus fredricksonii TaxID=1653334 RepID=A0A0P7X3W1_9HYPH|nr:MFS transporter [Saliniramus fredricksonii]KPQ09456.1 MAG: Arabinose efflux permease [Saliniramus fredricksonii]SCC78542.1 Major Facilitator Superfamily protein [Saliniramus fredricksonii]